MRQPKVSLSSQSYKDIKSTYDDINSVESEVLKRDMSEYVVKTDPTTTTPFLRTDNSLPKLRLVIYNSNAYIFMNTSLGWKYLALT